VLNGVIHKRGPRHRPEETGQGQVLLGSVRNAVLRSESYPLVGGQGACDDATPPESGGLYEQVAWSTLGPFAMWPALPTSDYYSPSAPDQTCGATHPLRGADRVPTFT